jgi:hypothetical protein
VHRSRSVREQWQAQGHQFLYWGLLYGRNQARRLETALA